MESILQRLEERTDELIEMYNKATARSNELEQRVGELEEELKLSGDAGERLEALEKERDQLAQRLEKVLKLIDDVLSKADTEPAE